MNPIDAARKAADAARGRVGGSSLRPDDTVEPTAKGSAKDTASTAAKAAIKGAATGGLAGAAKGAAVALAKSSTGKKVVAGSVAFALTGLIAVGGLMGGSMTGGVVGGASETQQQASREAVGTSIGASADPVETTEIQAAAARVGLDWQILLALRTMTGSPEEPFGVSPAYMGLDRDDIQGQATWLARKIREAVETTGHKPYEQFQLAVGVIRSATGVAGVAVASFDDAESDWLHDPQAYEASVAAERVWVEALQQEPTMLQEAEARSVYQRAKDWYIGRDTAGAASTCYGSAGAEVAEWSGPDAYSHDLRSRRIGITAEMLDGYLESTGIDYDRSRVSGAKFLEWQQSSGIDARALIAIAIHESSLGTAGVATKPGANMFGYGAFDSNPGNATAFNDEIGALGVGKNIVNHKNYSFRIMDEKAQAYANGTLTSDMGGVYYTDTTGTGVRRAATMGAVEAWIKASILEQTGSDETHIVADSDPVTDNDDSAPTEGEARCGVVNVEVVDGAVVRPGLNNTTAAPAWGNKYTNGTIPLSEMVALSWLPSCTIHPSAAAALEALNEVYKADHGGQNLPSGGGASCYRNYAQQVATKAAKGWLAAKPGFSNHGWGLAVDFSGSISNFGGVDHKWMRENAPKFGWFHPDWAEPSGSKPEAWHWEFDVRASTA